MKLRLVIACLGILLLTGQTPRQAPHPLADYESPATIRIADWFLMQANLRLVTDLDNRHTQEVQIPVLSYDSKAHKVRGSVRVSRATAQGDLDALRRLLLDRAITAFVEVEFWMPEIKGADFELKFSYMDWTPGGKNLRRVDFARYTAGELTFK